VSSGRLPAVFFLLLQGQLVAGLPPGEGNGGAALTSAEALPAALQNGGAISPFAPLRTAMRETGDRTRHNGTRESRAAETAIPRGGGENDARRPRKLDTEFLVRSPNL